MGKISSCAVTLCLLGGALADAGAANATIPSLVGKTYAKATEMLSSWHLAYEVTSTLGTELPRNDCTIVTQRMRPASSFGSIKTPAKLLLALDCTAPVATATEAGKSAGSPAGHAEKQEKILEWWRANTPEGEAWCKDNLSSHPNWDVSLVKGCAPLQ